MANILKYILEVKVAGKGSSANNHIEKRNQVLLQNETGFFPNKHL